MKYNDNYVVLRVNISFLSFTFHVEISLNYLSTVARSDLLIVIVCLYAINFYDDATMPIRSLSHVTETKSKQASIYHRSSIHH